MPIAILSVVPQSDTEWASWHFAHMAHHRDMIDKVARDLNTHLTEYQLDPPSRDPTWFYQHQQMHNQLDAVFGIPSLDMTTIDWNDKDSIEAWVYDNFTQHQNEANATGVD